MQPANDVCACVPAPVCTAATVRACTQEARHYSYPQEFETYLVGAPSADLAAQPLLQPSGESKDVAADWIRHC